MNLKLIPKLLEKTRKLKKVVKCKVRQIRPSAKFNDYEIGYQAHRSESNSAFVCLTEATFEEVASTNFDEAIKCRDSEKWLSAMEEKKQAFENNKTWVLVLLPPGKHSIDNRWVLRIKNTSDGSIERYRARLVALGVFQRAGFDYDETFSPVARYDAIRAVIAVAVEENLVLGQFDIKSAFLNGDIDAEIYMTQPQGFDDGTGRACLLKNLYMVLSNHLVVGTSSTHLWENMV